MGPSDSWPFAALAARWFLQAQVSRVAHTAMSTCRAQYPGGPPVRPNPNPEGVSEPILTINRYNNPYTQ